MAKTKTTSTSKKRAPARRKVTKKAAPKSPFAQKNVLIAIAVFLIIAIAGIFLWQTTFAATAPKERHFIQNTEPKDAAHLKTLGYNIIDGTPDDIGSVNKYPSGVQAMIWTGSAFCPQGDKGKGDEWMAWSSFKNLVYNHRNNSKIYGYFLIDEPNTKGCGLGKDKLAQMIRDRADYIHCFAIQADKFSNGKHKVASDGSCLNDKGEKVARKGKHKAYLVDEWDHQYANVSQKLTHVDIFAIDPYPCRSGGCKYSGGQDEFLQRIDRAKKYYPQSAIAPTYQAFGGDGWKLPSKDQMKQIQAYYDKYLPGSTFDVAYSYRDNKSGGPGDTYPGLIHAPSSLVQVVKDHNFKN